MIWDILSRMTRRSWRRRCFWLVCAFNMGLLTIFRNFDKSPNNILENGVRCQMESVEYHEHTMPSMCLCSRGSCNDVFNQSAISNRSSRLGIKSTVKKVNIQYRIATNVRTRTIRCTASFSFDDVFCKAQWNRQIRRWQRSTALRYVR